MINPKPQAVPSVDFYVHPTAIIDAPADIGPGSKIWHFCHVMAGAVIGADCILGQNVFVAAGVRIGRNCKIQNNVSLYEGVTLEDNVFCGPSCVFTNVKHPRSAIVRRGQYSPTHVEEGVTLGANCTVVCGVRLGRRAFIAAGAVVAEDVPPYALMAGVPARRIGWAGRSGYRLRPAGAEDGRRFVCPETGELYEQEDERTLRPMENPPPMETPPSAPEIAKEAATAPVPLLDLKRQYAAIKDEVTAAIACVVESQGFILGPEVAAFEEEVARALGAPHAIACASGSDALLLALMALELEPGDEVITSPYTFFATAGSIVRLGLRPVFCDIDPRTFNLDPAALEARITPRTGAIVPVHLFGRCAPMEPILALAERRGLAVIEDAAQAIGARTGGRGAGTMGLMGCFSFFPAKNLGGYGDGGLLTTADDALARKLRSLRVHGSSERYFHERVGLNSRLDALQAAVLRVKLPHLERWSEARAAHARRYAALFEAAGIVQRGELGKLGEPIEPIEEGKIVLPMTKSDDEHDYDAEHEHDADSPFRIPHSAFPQDSAIHNPQSAIPSERHVYNQYVIRAHAARRDALREHLTKLNIGTAIYYPLPLHLQPCFRDLGYKAGDLPISEQASRETLALPVFPELRADEQQRVVDAIAGFMNA